MNPEYLVVGDTIEDSPAGPGTITSITQAGWPRVNEIAVGCLRRTDGVLFDPYGHYPRKANMKPKKENP